MPRYEEDQDRRRWDDDEVVEVTRKDLERWNAAAKVVENSWLIVKFITVMGFLISFGIGLLVGLKQLIGAGK